MFPPNTYLTILTTLNWSIARADDVKAALAMAETMPEIEVAITGTLVQLAAVSESLLAEQSSANAGLIKADVLEWASPEARSGGMIALKARLTQELANLLGLEWSNNFIYPGGATSVGIKVD